MATSQRFFQDGKCLFVPGKKGRSFDPGVCMKTVFLAMIRFYKRCISPYTPASCRFEPTCSQYAYEAITRYGAIKGGFLALRRFLRCNPFSKHDYFDPVPWLPWFLGGKSMLLAFQLTDLVTVPFGWLLGFRAERWYCFVWFVIISAGSEGSNKHRQCKQERNKW